MPGEIQQDVDAVIGAGDACPCGSLPCPLFPQACGRGHIPLPVIQRALLDSRNRGVDGEAEDVTSAGHSPHKLHLLARQRVAEARREVPRVAALAQLRRVGDSVL